MKIIQLIIDDVGDDDDYIDVIIIIIISVMHDAVASWFNQIIIDVNHIKSILINIHDVNIMHRIKNAF